MTSNNFKQGIFWRSLVLIVNRLGATIVTLILAKILAPEDFGLVAVTSVLTNSLDVVLTVGLPTAIICKTKSIEEEIPTIFTYLLISSAVLYGISYLLAPVFAAFMGDTRFVAIIRVACISLFFNSLSNPHYAVSAKRMTFKLNAIPELTGKISFLILAPLMALHHFGYWSIIFATVINSMMRSLMYCLLVNIPIRFEINTMVLKGLMKFSTFVAINSVLMFCLESFDKIFIAKIISLTAAGYYYFAMRIILLPWQFISNITSSVLLPHLANKTSFNEKRRSFLNVNKSIAMVTCAVYGLLMIIVPELVNLYGSQWVGVTPIFYALITYGVIRTLFGRIASYLYATSRPYCYTFFLLLFSCFVYPVLWFFKGYFNAVAVAVIYSVGMFISFLGVAIYFLIQREFSLSDHLLPVIRSTLIAGGAWLFTIGLNQIVHLIHIRWVEIGINIIIYSGCLILGWRIFLWKEVRFFVLKLNFIKTEG